MQEKKNTCLIGCVAQSYFNNVPFELLLQHPDIDINLQDEKGWTALMHAVFHDHRIAAMQLIQHGADATLQNRQMETALDIANYLDRGEIISILLRENKQQAKKRRRIVSYDDI